MHRYLRAVGFSNIKLKKDLKPYIKEVIMAPDRTEIAEDEGEDIFVQIYKEYADGMGLMLCGLINDNDEFELEYYYPQFNGTGVTSKEDIIVERHAEKESYAGVCEDVKVGVSLIFYLQNVCEYKNERRLSPMKSVGIDTTLSALSLSGKILFPIDKTENQIKVTKEAAKNRNNLIEAARKGDEDAIESLTLEDMDTYSSAVPSDRTPWQSDPSGHHCYRHFWHHCPARYGRRSALQSSSPSYCRRCVAAGHGRVPSVPEY